MVAILVEHTEFLLLLVFGPISLGSRSSLGVRFTLLLQNWLIVAIFSRAIVARWSHERLAPCLDPLDKVVKRIRSWIIALFDHFGSEILPRQRIVEAFKQLFFSEGCWLASIG